MAELFEYLAGLAVHGIKWVIVFAILGMIIIGVSAFLLGAYLF